MSASIRQQAGDVVETARKAGLPSDDPLTLLLTKLASLAETVSSAERQCGRGRSRRACRDASPLAQKNT